MNLRQRIQLMEDQIAHMRAALALSTGMSPCRCGEWLKPHEFIRSALVDADQVCPSCFLAALPGSPVYTTTEDSRKRSAGITAAARWLNRHWTDWSEEFKERADPIYTRAIQLSM